MDENKFAVNNTYRCSTLYGGVSRYTVVDRTDKQITMREEWLSEDTNENQKEYTKFDIDIDNGIERVLIWEYHGHEAYIYANESI